MKQVGEQLDPVDQARARARERGGGVDGDDPLGAERAQPLARGRGPAPPPRRRRARTASRRRPRAVAAASLPTSTTRDFSPASPSTSVAAGGRDHLGHPVAADVDRVEPLERRHARARAAPATAARDRREAGAKLARAAARRDRGSPVAQASRTRSPSTSSRVSGSSEITSGAARQPRGDRAHVVVGDGADRAQRLGHDQVGLELRQRLLVEPVERLAAAGDLAHAGVDLGGRQAVGDHARGQLRQLAAAARVIALVGDGDDASRRGRARTAPRWPRGPGSRSASARGYASAHGRAAHRRGDRGSGSASSTAGAARATRSPRRSTTATSSARSSSSRRLVEPAEEMGHHPDLEISWSEVKVSITNHSAGGLTDGRLRARRADRRARLIEARAGDGGRPLSLRRCASAPAWLYRPRSADGPGRLRRPRPRLRRGQGGAAGRLRRALRRRRVRGAGVRLPPPRRLRRRAPAADRHRPPARRTGARRSPTPGSSTASTPNRDRRLGHLVLAAAT